MTQSINSIQGVQRSLNRLSDWQRDAERRLRSLGSRSPYQFFIVVATEKIEKEKSGKCNTKYRRANADGEMKFEEREVISVNVYNHTEKDIEEGDEFPACRDVWGDWYKVSSPTWPIVPIELTKVEGEQGTSDSKPTWRYDVAIVDGLEEPKTVLEGTDPTADPHHWVRNVGEMTEATFGLAYRILKDPPPESEDEDPYDYEITWINEQMIGGGGDGEPAPLVPVTLIQVGGGGGEPGEPANWRYDVVLDYGPNTGLTVRQGVDPTTAPDHFVRDEVAEKMSAADYGIAYRKLKSNPSPGDADPYDYELTWINEAIEEVDTDPAPIVPVKLTKVEGEQGDGESKPTWRYDVELVYGPNAGQTVLQSTDPTAPPHHWRRHIGQMEYADYGLAYRKPKVNAEPYEDPWSYELTWINEILIAAICEEEEEGDGSQGGG